MNKQQSIITRDSARPLGRQSWLPLRLLAIFYRYPNPSGKSAAPIHLPSPFFIVTVIGLLCAVALWWLWIFLATQPVEIERPVDDGLPDIDSVCFKPGVDFYDCYARPV